MKKRRDKIESLPGDGWIKIAPGESFGWHKDQPTKPNLFELRHWMTQIRGGVLAQSFEIENQLILMTLADEFGTNDHGSVSPEYVQREQEYREEHSLGSKIRRAKPIIRARREKEEADKIIQKLIEFRDLRNLLAHYPCWLEPVNEAGNEISVGLKLYICDRSHVWEVDPEQAREWQELLFFVRVSVDSIAREIVGALPLNPDGSPPMGERHIISGGHSQQI